MIAEKLLIVNFGGPRNLEEVEPFLISLLTDRDVITSKLPDFIHKRLFTRIAKKRAQKVVHDYTLIGGKSPIYEDTEFIAEAVSKETGLPYLTFHRYLPATHGPFLEQMKQERDTHFIVFPLFPQFSYSTTGSIARWFSEHLVCDQLHWIKSYPDDPYYVHAMVETIKEFLTSQGLEESETILLYSAHGLPQIYIDRGDIYQKECQRSFEAIAHHFPNALNKLSYQSKFGKGEWLRPYTDEFCHALLQPRQDDKQVIFIPLSFTSDHVETLYEIEYQYLPIIRQRGLKAFRLPALNRHPTWIHAISKMIRSISKEMNDPLFRIRS